MTQVQEVRIHNATIRLADMTVVEKGREQHSEHSLTEILGQFDGLEGVEISIRRVADTEGVAV